MQDEKCKREREKEREREERIYEVTLVMLWLFQLQQVPQEEYKQHTQVIINVINIDTIKRDRVSLSLSLSFSALFISASIVTCHK